MHSHDSDSHAHGHSHGHGPGHAHGSIKNKKVLWGVLALSSTYMVAEIIGGILSGSLALLADAGHMALDAAAVVLGLIAFWISQRPPTEEKTFGYYRAEILAALVNAVTLVLISIWIFYEAWHRLSSPPEVQGKLMTIVAAGGLLVNFVSLYIMAKDSRESLNMRGVWLHLLTDTLGSVAALTAAFLVWQFEWTLADPIISIVIGALILFGAWRLLVDCVNVLLVGVPDGVSLPAIKRDLEALPSVKEVHDLHVWAMNTGITALSAHVQLSTETDHAKVLEAATEMLRERHRIDHATLQLEPPTFAHPETHFCAPGKPFHVHSPAH